MLYTAFAAVILIVTKAPMLGVAFVLFLAPVLIIWQRVDIRTRLLIPISFVALAATVVLQAFAYKQGLWYELAPSGYMFLGAGPIESYVFACLLFVYLVVMYEYFFDNQANRTRTTQKAIQIATLSVLLAITFGYVFLSSATIVQNGFAILVGFLALALAAAGTIRQRLLHSNVIRKALLFTLSVLPVGLMAEFVLLSSNIRIYANLNDYLLTFQFFGYQFPLEAVFLILLLPMWIVVIYELCFDDGR